MGSELLQNLLNLTLADVVKWLVVAGLLLYTAFAVVVVRQVAVMSEAVEATLNGVLKVLAWAHLGMVVLLVVVAIVVL